MLAFVLTLLMTPVLSLPTWEAREAASAVLTLHGDWTAVDRAWRTATDPETKARLQSIRAVLTVREVDSIAAGEFPPADDIGWPCKNSLEYAEGGVPEMYRVSYQEISTTYWNDSKSYTWIDHWNKLQRHRTRAGLIAYAGRTGDWRMVCLTLRR